MTTKITRRTALAGLTPPLRSRAPAVSARPPDHAAARLHARRQCRHHRASGRRRVEQAPGPARGGGDPASAPAARCRRQPWRARRPTGSTLTILPSGHPVAAALYKQLSYNVIDDFTFISMLTENPFILVTYPDHPAKTIADVIKAAQADPGKLTYASAGNGTGMHLASELFVAMAKAKIQHVPYRGSPQALTDLHRQARRFPGRHAAGAAALPFRRTAAADRHHRHEAVLRAARRADHRVRRPARLFGDRLARPRRPGRPAGRPGEAAQRAGPGDSGGACRDRAACALGADLTPTTPEAFKARVVSVTSRSGPR